MAGSGRLLDYLSSGVIASRPTSLALSTGGLGIYFATDTNAIWLWNGSAWVALPAASGVTWGSITGTLSSQTDLQTALNGKLGTGSTAAAASVLSPGSNINGVAYTGGSNITVPDLVVGINAQSGTTYTLVLTDLGKDIRLGNASAITLTVPPNSSVPFPIGGMIVISQDGAGAVTATAGAGVTLRAPNGAATTAQYDYRVLEKIGTDEWRVC